MRLRIETVMVMVALSIMAGVHLGTVIATSAYRQVQIEKQAEAGAMPPDEVRALRLFARILWRESSLRPCVTGDHDKPHIAFGPAQYQERTFEQFKTEARMPWLNWKNPEHQLILTWWAVKNGKESAWTTAKNADY